MILASRVLAKPLGVSRPTSHCSRVFTVPSGPCSWPGIQRIVVMRPRSIKIEKLEGKSISGVAIGLIWGKDKHEERVREPFLDARVIHTVSVVDVR